MNLPTEIFGEVIVVHAPDTLAGDEATALPSLLLNMERRNIVFDLDHVESLGSTGLTALLDAQDELREQGGDIKVATGNRYNRKILEMTRIDQQLEVFDNVIDAVKSFA